MIHVENFLQKVREIAERPLTYRTGGSGADGTCDCIGLIMGAMKELGHAKYDMHSTNYFARFQMDTLAHVEPALELKAGTIVYKARADITKLHQRYQYGGRYFNGDLLDYYHVGVVESSNPLVIVHCTEYGNVSGITRDYSTKEWTHAGVLKGITFEKTTEPEAEPMKEKAIVIAKSGDDVNMRVRPSIKGGLIMRVPIGAGVLVTETAENDAGETWSRIEYGGYTGYMMRQFLKRAADSEDSQETDAENEHDVTITLPKNAAEAILRALVEVLKA